MRRKCRIWWPKFLASSELSSNHLLFGWVVSCSSTCIDIVVAFACNEISLSCCQSTLQEILSETNGNMPVFLQDKSVFALLGQGKMLKFGMEETNGISSATNRQEMFRENYDGRSCECSQFDGLMEKSWEASATDSCWIQLVYDSHEQYGRDFCWLPKLHHIHWNGQVVSQFDVHVIVYDTPIYGLHHFSLDFWYPSELLKAPLKKPKWVDELDRIQPVFDLDTVIMAINSAAAAKTVIEKHMDTKRSSASFSIIYACLTFMWHAFAISVASTSTLFYITLQLFYSLASMGSKAGLYDTLARIFCATSTNVQIRCCQILYWPIFLQKNGFRLQSCVEFAENAALFRHSMWSSLAVDLLLGNLFGLSLLFSVESVCLWLSAFASDVTNELLRTGCVWLMGVPAGFKLNIELAGVLGMLSLNAIQIWSTLWIFIGFHVIYFIKGLAVLGIVLGVTIPAALIMDTISLATLHVSTLHCVMSLLYSRQIQSLAALWRLFRGRKWNPLRQRLDSYDYTVKQHAVGSLLFTPLLLLLPTTSVFYIFFTILNTTITFARVLIGVTISVIHGTPYIKILLWLLRWRRFPSGIWFEILSSHSDTLEFVYHDKVGSPSDNSQKDNSGEKRSSTVVSALHSNFLSIGQVVSPHYKKIFSEFSTFLTASAYGALTGTRISSTLGTGFPSPMPWMIIPSIEYWCLCYNSILSCMIAHNCYSCQ